MAKRSQGTMGASPSWPRMQTEWGIVDASFLLNLKIIYFWKHVCGCLSAKKRWWPLDMGPRKVNKLTCADPNQRHYLLALETCVFKTLIMGPPLSAAAFEHIDVSHEKCTPWIFIAPWWSHDSWLPTDVLRLLAVRFGPGAGLIKNFKRGEGNPRVFKSTAPLAGSHSGP